MPETSISPPAVARPSKPVSEALLNEKVSYTARALRTNSVLDERLLTMRYYSGTAAYHLSSSAHLSVSDSVSSSQYSFSNEERGLRSSVWDLVLDGHMRSAIALL